MLMVGTALAPGRSDAHPIHTTLTHIAWEPGGRDVAVTIRIFSDDLAAAVGATAQPVSDAMLFAYARRTLQLASADGRPLPLIWGGARRTGDLVWITVHAPAPPAPALRVQARMLFERYADQVNIVQAVAGTHRESVLFTRGDGVKTLTLAP